VLAIGCSSGQGWYFGKPMEADQAAQLVARRSEPPRKSTNSSTRAA
jgi:EAL domain-containing protein (putative c-di-GMP-specific phosphodiesterase class I)